MAAGSFIALYWMEEGRDADVAAARGARLELIAPFIPTIPGTTQYLDELW